MPGPRVPPCRARCPRRFRAARGDRGAAALEFALVVPLLLLLVFGIIAYGYMLSFRQALSQGAAEGARAAATTLSSTTSTQRTALARQQVESALASYGVTCSTPSMSCDIQVDVNCANPDLAAPSSGPACVKVALSYRYRARPLVPVPLASLAMPERLRYQAVVELTS